MNSDIFNPEEEMKEALPAAAIPVEGTPGDDNIEELGVSNTTYNMLEGNDTVIITEGTNNIINGNQGNDLVGIIDGINNVVNGNEGDDGVVIINGVNNILNGNEGNDTLGASGGSDNVFNGNQGNDTFTIVDTHNNILNGNEGDDTLLMTNSYNNILNGDAGADSFNVSGESHDNVLNGGDENDIFILSEGSVHNNILNGGAGNDIVEIDETATNNIFNGGEGNDTLEAKLENGAETFQFNFELKTNFETISFANGIKQSNFVSQYDAWLKSLGTDLNADGKVDVVWHQNSATQPVMSVEGVDSSLFSDVKSVTLSSGQVRYYNASFGDEALTSHDGHDLYNHFEYSHEDKLYFSGMTRDQFTTDNFYINESGSDTTIGLNDGSWSVTLANTTGLSEAGIDFLRENPDVADFLVFDNGVV